MSNLKLKFSNYVYQKMNADKLLKNKNGISLYKEISKNANGNIETTFRSFNGLLPLKTVTKIMTPSENITPAWLGQGYKSAKMFETKFIDHTTGKEGWISRTVKTLTDSVFLNFRNKDNGNINIDLKPNSILSEIRSSSMPESYMNVSTIQGDALIKRDSSNQIMIKWANKNNFEPLTDSICKYTYRS